MPTLAEQGVPTASAEYPRRFRGRQLQMISFPLGGVAAGILAWADAGSFVIGKSSIAPTRVIGLPAFPGQSGNSKRELTSPLPASSNRSYPQPPYEGQDGLGSNNVPGLSRLESAIFTCEYPLAHIEFQDRSLPVKVELTAFSPFIPHDADDSGLPERHLHIA